MNRFVLSVSRCLMPALVTACLATGALAQQGPPGGLGVTVLNTPLPTRDVDNAARQPIQVQFFQNFVGTVAHGFLYTVPAGKRLVVEHFSSEATVATGSVINTYGVGVGDPAQPGVLSFEHFIPPAYHAVCDNCAGSELWVVSQPIRMYVDAGKALFVSVKVTGPTVSTDGAFFDASGYLVDVP